MCHHRQDISQSHICSSSLNIERRKLTVYFKKVNYTVLFQFQQQISYIQLILFVLKTWKSEMKHKHYW